MSGLDTRTIDLTDLPQEQSPDVEHEFRVFITEPAFDRIAERGAADLSREIGGVLVGQICKDSGGPYVRVDTTIDALHAEEKGAELTFTHSTWQHIHEQMDREHQGRRIVGWYHTHPGFGIFLSDRDLFIQQSFFNLAFQVALVYDPKSHEHGVFVWHENEPTRCRRYWVGRQELRWDGSRSDAGPELKHAAAPKPAPAEPGGGSPALAGGPVLTGGNSTPQLDRTALAIAAAVILLIGALAGWWFGRGSAANLVQQAQADIDRVRLTAAQDIVRGLNTDLILFLRESIAGQGVLRPLDEVLASLESASEALTAEDRETALQSLARGRQELTSLRDTYARADTSLRTLVTLSRVGTVDTRELARSITAQQAALGQLYVELAEDVAKTDVRRAQRLLQTAMTIDPGNAPRYERRRQELGREKSP